MCMIHRNLSSVILHVSEPQSSTDLELIILILVLTNSAWNFASPDCDFRTTWIKINRFNINLNDYYNPVMDYYNSVIDYYNPVIDYYNLLLRFEPCLNPSGLILILCKISINLFNMNSWFGLILIRLILSLCNINIIPTWV